MSLKLAAAYVVLLAALPFAHGGVVINEVFYNAPDDLDDVQWIELHNTADQPADLGGWTLDGGKVFTFPQGTMLDGKGYLVVAFNPEAFNKAYKLQASGPLKRALKRGGERIELRNAAGERADLIRYKDGSPWPVSADGYSASLERICPDAPGDVAENWAGSPLPDAPRPAGTPGKPNANFSAAVPPVVSVPDALAVVAPGEPLRVRAEVKGAAVTREVTLLYRAITDAADGKEEAVPMTDEGGGRFVASIPAQQAGTLLRYRVKAVAEGGARRLYPAEHALRPTLSTYVHGPWDPAKISFGLLILTGADREAAAAQDEQQPGGPGPRGRGGFGPPGGFRGPPGDFGPRGGFGRPGRFGPPGAEAEDKPRPPRGSAAFVYVDQKSGRAEVFDPVNAVRRGGQPGYKIFFHKDRPLNRMNAVSLVFEGNERSLVVEALSYDVYRRAGNAAPLTEFVRLWVNGRPQGYHLIVERPNKAFLRRNKVDDNGNLYKARWFGRGIEGQHVKKTHEREGHDDLLAVIDLLERTGGDADAQWTVIRERFDVEQMATHYAVNMVLSHWDGFFNNFYTYHDTKRDKWQMYPWDHDKTWGVVDGWGGEPVVDIPLTFGMEGAVPPGGRPGAGGGFGGGFGGPFGGGGPGWWRPGGYFSRPLLANPHFRKVFLKRVRDILDRVYTEETYAPMIDELAERLKEDAALRAQARGDNADAAAEMMADNVRFLKTHLRKRREYLLGQDELRRGAGDDR